MDCFEEEFGLFLPETFSSSAEGSFQFTRTADSKRILEQLDQLKRTISGNPKTEFKFLLNQLTVLGSRIKV